MKGVRPAETGEEEALTALCMRSKAHWAYDVEFMRQAATALTVTPAMVEEGRVLVAEDGLGGILGVAAVEATETAGRFDLALLFVEPSEIGTGVGRRLFGLPSGLLKEQGGSSLEILADPFAASFYPHLGGTGIGETPSDAIPGRYLPLFNYRISQRRAAI